MIVLVGNPRVVEVVDVLAVVVAGLPWVVEVEVTVVCVVVLDAAEVDVLDESAARTCARAPREQAANIPAVRMPMNPVRTHCFIGRSPLCDGGTRVRRL